MSKMLNECTELNDDQYVPVMKGDATLQGRLSVLASHFLSQFNEKPSFFVKVPGRVNIIGEHVDYCGYPVCPMAIEQNIIVALAVTSKNEIHLSNVESQYPEFHSDNFSNIRELQFDDGPAWHKYFLCGVKGALESIPRERWPMGILVAVWGNIPPNSGLSSSSALVSAAVLATVHASHMKLRKEQLATISAEAERYIGTMGGGMDQAIAFLGKAGSAKLIEFNPLRATDVELPKNAVFVIAHSLTFCNKALTVEFNLRVTECRFAAQVLAKKRGVEWKSIRKLIDIQRRLGKSLEEMTGLVVTELRKEPYTIDEICDILGSTKEDLEKEIPSLATFDSSQTFKLRQRAEHVFRESERVISFQRVNESKSLDDCDRFRQLGNLMSDSHTSLRELYDCSHPMVDSLVDAAMDCGAFGARLTGAGWGGCIVAITQRSEVTEFVQALREKFYSDKKKTDVGIEKLVFPTEPNQGATIYTA